MSAVSSCWRTLWLFPGEGLSIQCALWGGGCLRGSNWSQECHRAASSRRGQSEHTYAMAVGRWVTGPVCPSCQQLPRDCAPKHLGPAPGVSSWVTANATHWGGTSSQRSLCLWCQHLEQGHWGWSWGGSRWGSLEPQPGLCLGLHRAASVRSPGTAPQPRCARLWPAQLQQPRFSQAILSTWQFF